MKTIENNKSRKIKTIEVKYSNMSFIVEVHSHYMAALNNPGWSTNRYTAKIKETGERISGGVDKKFIKSQMELINSRPDLFLKLERI